MLVPITNPTIEFGLSRSLVVVPVDYPEQATVNEQLTLN